MYYLGIIIASIFGYLWGSISFSIIIVRWKKGIDIRSVGSGNAGATNTTRELGKLWGFIVVFLDGLKVVVTTLVAVALSCIPSPLFSETSYFIPAIFVLIGHCWPIWYKFKGGKAVSCFLGLLFIANVWYLAIFLVLWFSAAAISRRVSIASIIAALIVGLVIIWLPWVSGTNDFTSSWNSYESWWQVWLGSNGHWLRFSWVNYLHLATAHVSGYNFADSLLEINIIVLIGMIILAWRHFPNIARIKRRQEPETFPKMNQEEKQQYKEYVNDRSAKEVKKEKRPA